MLKRHGNPAVLCVLNQCCVAPRSVCAPAGALSWHWLRVSARLLYDALRFGHRRASLLIRDDGLHGHWWAACQRSAQQRKSRGKQQGGGATGRRGGVPLSLASQRVAASSMAAVALGVGPSPLCAASL